MLITTHPAYNFGRPTSCWAIIDPTTRNFTGQFLSAFLGERGQKKHNIIERKELAPAHADIVGSGKGLSGTAHVAAVRDDRGWSPDLKPVEDL